MAIKQCKQCGKKFRPRKGLEDRQEDCTELCLANRFDTLVRKTRKIAKIFAWTMGYRSMSEVRFAAQLRNKRIPFRYESETVDYQYDPQKYTVDFTIKTAKNGKVHFEYKGKLDNEARRKLRAIKRCNPDLDLRLVFEKPNNKLYRGAKMRYWEWAERHGFQWYDCRSVDKIKCDISGGGKCR